VTIEVYMITEIAKMTALELIYILGPIFVFGFLLGFLENLTNKNMCHSFGKNALLITGIIGVPVHEISHAIAAKIFFHKISEIKLFQKPDAQGVMGYVTHSYNSKNIYQLCGNFFIGIAPIFGGSIAIITLIYLFFPDGFSIFFNSSQQLLVEPIFSGSLLADIFDFQFEFFKSIFDPNHFKQITFYIFIFLTLAISSHMSLSIADLKGALSGLVIMIVILFALNILGFNQLFLSFDILKFNLLICLVLMLATVFSLFSFLISLVFRMFSR
jgi:hypothetical protein